MDLAKCVVCSASVVTGLGIPSWTRVSLSLGMYAASTSRLFKKQSKKRGVLEQSLRVTTEWICISDISITVHLVWYTSTSALLWGSCVFVSRLIFAFPLFLLFDSSRYLSRFSYSLKLPSGVSSASVFFNLICVLFQSSSSFMILVNHLPQTRLQSFQKSLGS